MRQLFYYKMWQVYYKKHQAFYFKMRQFYYKMRQLLQIATILIQNTMFIKNCDSTSSDNKTMMFVKCHHALHHYLIVFKNINQSIAELC